MHGARVDAGVRSGARARLRFWMQVLLRLFDELPTAVRAAEPVGRAIVLGAALRRRFHTHRHPADRVEPPLWCAGGRLFHRGMLVSVGLVVAGHGTSTASDSAEARTAPVFL